jgi:NitT/TauT family transport system substrate-binding protein
MPRRRLPKRQRHGRESRDMRAITALMAAIGVLAAACAARAEDVVRLGNLKFAHYGAVSYMKEIASRHGLRIEERVFAKGIDIIPAMIAGEIDISASGVDGAIAGRASGVPLTIVAGFAKGGVRIVAAKDSGIAGIRDFKGRKVGVTRGGTQELALLSELGQNGLSWSDKPGKDVQILYMNYPDLNQALMAKNIDAMCQSEPYSSQALNKGFGVEIMKPYDTELGEPARALVMTEKLYGERPDVAMRVMRTFVEATATFIAKPEVAEKYVREVIFKNQVSHDEYNDAIGNSPFTYDITVEHVQATIDLMQRYNVGRMAKPPVAADFVKLDLLRRAKSDLGVQ